MAQQEIEARLERVIFHNERNGYTVARFAATKQYYHFTAAGHLENPTEDRVYLLNGDYTEHPRFGRQFGLCGAEPVLPKKKNAVMSFLSSSSFPGIGARTAELVVETLGDECLDEIDADPKVLEKVSGLSAIRRRTIVEGIRKFKGVNRYYTELLGYGLTDRQIQMLTNTYHEDVMKVLDQDCFRPLYDISGFGLSAAEKLANARQIPMDDLSRLDANVYETVRKMSMRSGSTFFPAAEVASMFRQLPFEMVEESLSRLAAIEAVEVDERKCVYPFGLCGEEQDIAECLAEIRFPVDPIAEDELEAAIAETEFALNITYDEGQKEAFRTFFASPLLVLNGGPGTGKSTAVRGILSLCEHFYPQAAVVLCAPTGRAAKRLATLSGQEARTIHSLLKWNMDENIFGKNEDDPIEADILIVDEFSMVDTHLFAALLKALPPRCRLMLIGDEDQLESVGPGCVFEDLLRADICPVVRLNKIFRQANGSGIVELAADIREEKPLVYKDGVEFLNRPQETILPALLQAAGQPDLEEMQVLAPKYKGVAGIDAINEALQDLCNPPGAGKSELRIGSMVFRTGDKVMLLKNMPDEEVFNGDIGYIKKIEGKAVTVDFEGIYVKFETDILYYLNLAYCISVHKSQGSEYQKVFCIVDPSAGGFMNKRLLYTAISRAKKQLTLIGSPALFETQVRSSQMHHRRTSLQDRLKEAFENGA